MNSKLLKMFATYRADIPIFKCAYVLTVSFCVFIGKARVNVVEVKEIHSIFSYDPRIPLTTTLFHLVYPQTKDQNGSYR